MPNPNYMHAEIIANYGPDAEHLQSCHFEVPYHEFCDQDENKYIHGIDSAVGVDVLLDAYNRVQQVVIQNLDADHDLQVDYFDEVTAYHIIVDINPGKTLAFCRPDVTQDILLICADADETVDAHVWLLGEYD